MYDDVVKRLESLGYVVVDTDRWLVEFAIDKTENTIKNGCNVGTIPDGLHHVAVDMACGEFLFAKKGSGQLNDFNVEAAVKQIKEGDTSITYAIGDTSITLDGLIKWLIENGKPQFVTYRRFVW